MSVFVIINEWTDIKNTTSAEVTGDSYFTTRESAWTALHQVAESFGHELDSDGFSFSLEDHTPGLQFEEYYIQELMNGDSK